MEFFDGNTPKFFKVLLFKDETPGRPTSLLLSGTSFKMFRGGVRFLGVQCADTMEKQVVRDAFEKSVSWFLYLVTLCMFQ